MKHVKRAWGKRLALLGLILFLSVLSACAEKKVQWAGGAYAFIFTNSLEEDSEFVVVDAQGKEVSSVRLSAMGIFQITSDHRGGWILPEKFGDTLTYVKADGSVEEEECLLFPLTVREDRELRIATYNTAYDYGTLEIKKGETVKRIKLDDLLIKADRDEQKVYVFSANPDTFTYKVIIVDLKSGAPEKEIPVPTALPETFRVMDGKLWMTDPDRPNVWLLDLKTHRLENIEVPGTSTRWVLEDADSIYIVPDPHQITVLDRKTLKKKGVLQLQLDKKEHSQLNMRMDEKHIYLLEQLEGGDAKFTVFDKKTGKRLQSFQLQAPRETLVQNFVLLKQGEES